MSPFAPETPSATLHRLLDQAQPLPLHYGPGYGNHLPMALAALDALGAGADRLQAFHDRYATRFGSQRVALDVPPQHRWDAALGVREAYAAVRAALLADLAARGRAAVLAGILPRLLESTAAAGFHGAIRTAHAIEADHLPELASALAAWVAAWRPLAAPRTDRSDLHDPVAWLDALDDLRRAHPPVTGDASLITDQIRTVADQPAYRSGAGRLRLDEADGAVGLAGLARAAADRYARSADFIALHVATGTRALRILAPWLPPGARARHLAPAFHAVAAAVLAAALPGTDATSAVPDPSHPAIGPGRVAGTGDDADEASGWAQIVARAVATDSEHAIKLVHAMVTQRTPDGDPAWRAAARTALMRSID